ncbi:hypothetical protein E8E11_005497 [Didymella keratinophila]|nr:hypothetical protein E8E11_005497 [Didymella keratinophila]
MLLPTVTKLLPLTSLAVTVTTAPAPALVVANAAVRNCESDYARCLRLRMSLDYCHETVCNMYNNEAHQCKPCQENGLPTVYDRGITHSTNDNSAGDVQVLNGRAGAKPPKNHCVVICTHAHCALLCTNPGHTSSGTLDTAEAAASTDTVDLLDLANAQPDQIGVPLEDGMTTVITNIDADGKLEGNCTWVCSGKSEAQCSLIEDGGALPEGQATKDAGKCEIVKKNKFTQIMVCQVPETAREAVTAG